MSVRFFCFFMPLTMIFFACSRQDRVAVHPLAADGSSIGAVLGNVEDADAGNNNFTGLLAAALRAAELPENISLEIQKGLAASPAFILDLFSVMEGDPSLWRLVDKERSLPSDYSPGDLVELRSGSFLVNREGMFLRRAAADALEAMAAAARAEGITLVAASAYRSYSWQTQVHNHWIQVLGREQAERVSARPGHSQHQLGLALDFAPIDVSFAQTAAGRWIAANASRFGWSLSYPYNFEAVTGYSWEPWHFRYVGKELAAFIDNYFDGIQQYALRFIYEWVKIADNN